MSFNPQAVVGPAMRPFWYDTGFGTFTAGLMVQHDPTQSFSAGDSIPSQYGSTATVCTVTAGCHPIGAVFGYATWTGASAPVAGSLVGTQTQNVGVAIVRGLSPYGVYVFASATVNDYLYVDGDRAGFCVQTASPDFSIRNGWCGKLLTGAATTGTQTLDAWIQSEVF